MKMYYNGLTFREIDGEPVCIIHDDASVVEIESEEEGNAMLENGDIEDYLVPDLFPHRILLEIKA